MDATFLQKMMDGYIECIWRTNSDDDQELGDPDLDNSSFAPETMLKIEDDCMRFWHEAYEKNLTSGFISPTQVGIDLWLTRNEHGAGFWSCPEIYGEKAAEILSDLVGWGTAYPEIDVYVGDDNMIYFAQNFVNLLEITLHNE